MENINSWKNINWSRTNQSVYRLQLRIYKAAANEEWEKMYKLQKLLIKSANAKFLSVRRVTQDNAGKKTLEVDGKRIQSPSEKFKLASQLKLDGKSLPIRRVFIPKVDRSQRLLGIPKIQDRAKQMLAYLALSPQWEAQFEECSYGFHPGRSVFNAIDQIWLGIHKKPKWVLNANITKCFDTIDHEYLLNKCHTYPEMRKQIKAWLKAGILYGREYVFPEMGTSQYGVISYLLANIALNGLRANLDKYINTLGGHQPTNRKALTYVRYADDFVLMYPDKEVLENLIIIVQEFLKPIGLKLNSKKKRIVHTFSSYGSPPGFTFLGFDIVQKKIWVKMRQAITTRKSNQQFITLITYSKKEVIRHKLKMRKTIRQYRGISQERLIQKLNPIIRGWALSKRTQISSQTFQALDMYLFIHLWKWARKRHLKMSKYKLKEKYWHQVGKRNWVFGVKTEDQVTMMLQLHSKIPTKRYIKVKKMASSFDENFIYIYQSKRIE